MIIKIMSRWWWNSIAISFPIFIWYMTILIKYKRLFLSFMLVLKDCGIDMLLRIPSPSIALNVICFLPVEYPILTLSLKTQPHHSKFDSIYNLAKYFLSF